MAYQPPHDLATAGLGQAASINASGSSSVSETQRFSSVTLAQLPAHAPLARLVAAIAPDIPGRLAALNDLWSPTRL
jgi:hypothetical protein